MVRKPVPKEFSRRDFFKWLGISGAAGAVGRFSEAGGTPAALASGNAPAAARVPTRTFGRTGMSLPILSLGGMFNTGQNHVLMRQALKWGVTYWDTAKRYNVMGSEYGIGDYFARFPKDRQKIFLVTKSPAINAKTLDDDLQASLDNLKTDHVDLFFIHKVDDAVDEMSPEVRQWARKAKKEGKIKWFGFSTHKNMAANLNAAAKMGWIDAIMTTYNYRFMVDDEMNRALDACNKAGIGLTAMKTQAANTWGHPVGDETDAALKLTQSFVEKGYTLHQARLMAVWSDPRISAICSQMENMSILKENVAAAAADVRLSRASLRQLSQYDLATASAYCAGCAGICEGALSRRVPVADVMRYLMYARSYGDLTRARLGFKRVGAQVRQGIEAIDFSEAEARCPRKMPIASLMHSALDELG